VLAPIESFEGVIVSRVPPAPLEGPTAPTEAIDRIHELRDGKVSLLYQTLLNAPDIAAAWCTLGTAVRWNNSLDDRFRELMTCLVASLADASYEGRSHEPLARKLGVSEEELACLPDWASCETFSDRDRTGLAFAEAVVDETVDDELFERTGEHFSLQERVEIAATAAYYVSIARFLHACGVS
jgi:4-carboxymuconolactone decarboxylase